MQTVLFHVLLCALSVFNITLCYFLCIFVILLHVYELCTVPPPPPPLLNYCSLLDHQWALYMFQPLKQWQSNLKHTTRFIYNSCWENTNTDSVFVTFLRHQRNVSVCGRGGYRAAWGMLTDRCSLFGLALALICSWFSQPNFVLGVRPITAGCHLSRCRVSQSRRLGRNPLVFLCEREIKCRQ